MLWQTYVLEYDVKAPRFEAKRAAGQGAWATSQSFSSRGRTKAYHSEVQERQVLCRSLTGKKKRILFTFLCGEHESLSLKKYEGKFSRQWENLPPLKPG